MKEQWKNAAGCDGVYAISNYGNIKRITRERGTFPGKVIKNMVSDRGYLVVCLQINGKRKNAFVHRLVLETFVGLCPDGMECCHYDGNRKNPRLDNLRWDTRSSNQLDSVRHGTKSNGDQRGSSNPNSKLTEEKVMDIKKHLKEDVLTGRQIAKMFGISPMHVSSIKNKKRWSWLDE